MGGALRCPKLVRYQKELNPSGMPLAVLVGGGYPHSGTPHKGVLVP